MTRTVGPGGRRGWGSRTGSCRRGPYCHSALPFAVPIGMLHTNDKGVRRMTVRSSSRQLAALKPKQLRRRTAEVSTALSGYNSNDVPL